MGLSDLLKTVSAAEDLGTAAVIASLLNADQLARFNMAARTNVEPADVIRFGKVLTLYGDLKPAGEGAEAFRKPASIGGRPVVGAVQNEAAA
jgi:hypothetical protein